MHLSQTVNLALLFWLIWGALPISIRVFRLAHSIQGEPKINIYERHTDGRRRLYHGIIK